MSELHSWLSTQHHGLRTYKSLKQKLIARASADPEHAALYRLLASMIDHYIDSFDEEPLPVDVADEVFARVLDIVRYAEDSVSRVCLSQIKSGHICDAVRQGPDGKEYALPSQQYAIGANPYPRIGACASHYNIYIRLEHMTKMPLAEHNNGVKAFPSDRTDQSLS